MPDEELFLDEEKRVDYIYQELWQQGAFVERDIIELILQLDLDFMLENGFAYIEEVDEFE